MSGGGSRQVLHLPDVLHAEYMPVEVRATLVSLNPAHLIFPLPWKRSTAAYSRMFPKQTRGGKAENQPIPNSESRRGRCKKTGEERSTASRKSRSQRRRRRASILKIHIFRLRSKRLGFRRWRWSPPDGRHLP